MTSSRCRTAIVLTLLAALVLLVPGGRAGAAGPARRAGGGVGPLVATPHGTRVDLTWTNPDDPTWQRTIVRVIAGDAAPGRETAGKPVYTGRGTTASFSPVGIGVSYSFAAFAQNIDGTTRFAWTTLDRVDMELTEPTIQCPYGEGMYLGLQLYDPDEYQYVGHVHVELVGRDSSGKVVFTRHAKTDADGNTGFPGNPKKTLIYQATFAGDPFHNSSSSNRVICTITANVKVTRIKPIRPPHGTPMTFTFTLAPVAKGIAVQLQQYKSGHWTKVATTTTDAKGAGKLVAKPAKKGTYRYRLHAPAYKSVIAGNGYAYTITVT